VIGWYRGVAEEFIMVLPHFPPACFVSKVAYDEEDHLQFYTKKKNKKKKKTTIHQAQINTLNDTTSAFHYLVAYFSLLAQHVHQRMNE